MNLFIRLSPLVLFPMQDTFIKIKVTPPQAKVILFPKAPIPTKPEADVLLCVCLCFFFKQLCLV